MGRKKFGILLSYVRVVKHYNNIISGTKTTNNNHSTIRQFVFKRPDNFKNFTLKGCESLSRKKFRYFFSLLSLSLLFFNDYIRQWKRRREEEGKASFFFSQSAPKNSGGEKKPGERKKTHKL